MQITWHGTLDEVSRHDWNSLFPGAPEDWDFYRGVEDAPPEQFSLGAVTIRSQAGKLLLAAPLFDVAYKLDTPFQGRMRQAMDWLHARRPGLTSVRVLGIGSPLSDNCSLGFASDLRCPNARAHSKP